MTTRRVEQAIRAADLGEAYHWPTIAAVLAGEVRRLRSLASPEGPQGCTCGGPDDQGTHEERCGLHTPRSPGGPDKELREQIAKAVAACIKRFPKTQGPWSGAIGWGATEYDIADAVLPLLTAERERAGWAGEQDRRVREALAEARERADALQRQVNAVRHALDDELANLADDGARLSHSVVRRIEAALSRTATEGDDE